MHFLISASSDFLNSTLSAHWLHLVPPYKYLSSCSNVCLPDCCVMFKPSNLCLHLLYQSSSWLLFTFLPFVCWPLNSVGLFHLEPIVDLCLSLWLICKWTFCLVNFDLGTITETIGFWVGLILLICRLCGGQRFWVLVGCTLPLLSLGPVRTLIACWHFPFAVLPPIFPLKLKTPSCDFWSLFSHQHLYRCLSTFLTRPANIIKSHCVFFLNIFKYVKLCVSLSPFACSLCFLQL